jgi:hypothetical protein
MRLGHSRSTRRRNPSRQPRAAEIRPLVVLAPATSLLIAAALAGCGPFGDDEGTGGDGGALSAEQFAHQGDEICASAQGQVAEVQRHPPTSRRASVRFADSLIEIFDDEVARLSQLDPPEDRRDALDRYLDARREAIDMLEEGRRAAVQNDPQGYADAQAEVASGQVERAELGREAGLAGCSHPLAGSPGPGSP